MKIETETYDRRTDEERAVLTWYVIGTDPSLARQLGKPSYAIWACRIEDSEQVLAWVKARGDMRRVREAPARSWRQRRGSHVSIYPVAPGHPALEYRA